MKLTRQQGLVLFDIAKSAMNQKNGFAGYSNEEIMKLLNQIILQQDNEELLDLETNMVSPDVSKIDKIDIKQNKDDLKDIKKNDEESFWD